MKIFGKYAIGLGLISLLSLNSCISTEVYEPEAPATSECIVLSLDAPALSATRSHEDYKLRYVAKIFQGASSSTWGNPLDRQEIIEGENANNQIIFKVPAGANYTIMVFADYIPENFTVGSDGYYQDYFYNTKNNPKHVVMRTTPGSDAQTVSPDFFNNDNYDCFFGITKLYKDEYEVIVPLTLTRATAKVTVEDTSDNSGVCSLSVDKLGLRKQLDFNFSPQSSTPASSDANKSLGNIALTQTVNITASNKELFFFFTLADDITSKQYVSVNFTVKNNTTSSDVKDITEIPVKVNYRTVVKGAFVPLDNDNNGGGGGGSTPGEDDSDNKKAGDIHVNLDTNSDWEMDELSK